MNRSQWQINVLSVFGCLVLLIPMLGMKTDKIDNWLKINAANRQKLAKMADSIINADIERNVHSAAISCVYVGSGILIEK